MSSYFRNPGTYSHHFIYTCFNFSLYFFFSLLLYKSIVIAVFSANILKYIVYKHHDFRSHFHIFLTERWIVWMKKKMKRKYNMWTYYCQNEGIIRISSTTTTIKRTDSAGGQVIMIDTRFFFILLHSFALPVTT